MEASTNPFSPRYATGIPAEPNITPGEWSTGLFECFSDRSNCYLTYWCPCITFGRIGEIVDKGTTSCAVHGALYAVICGLIGCQCLFSHMYRSKLRKQYNLPARPCNDCLVHCFCERCALCQEYRELTYRGLDPALGWEGNLQTQNQGVVMPPLGPGEMKR